MGEHRASSKRSCNKITKEIVEHVKEIAAKFPTATGEELGKFCNLGRSTVNRIKNGDYDYLLEDEPNLFTEQIMLCPFIGMKPCNPKCALICKDKNSDNKYCSFKISALSEYEHAKKHNPGK